MLSMQVGMLDHKRLQELDDMCHLQDKVVSSFEVSVPSAPVLIVAGSGPDAEQLAQCSAPSYLPAPKTARSLARHEGRSTGCAWQAHGGLLLQLSRQ